MRVFFFGFDTCSALLFSFVVRFAQLVRPTQWKACRSAQTRLRAPRLDVLSVGLRYNFVSLFSCAMKFPSGVRFAGVSHQRKRLRKRQHSFSFDSPLAVRRR